MRVRDVDLAHPPRSYAMLLVRLAIACFVPFAPVYLLVVVTGIMVGLDPLLVGMLRLAFTASVSMTIHELVHACLLSWRNPDMRVSISTDWLRDGLQESPATDTPGSCVRRAWPVRRRHDGHVPDGIIWPIFRLAGRHTADGMPDPALR